MPEDRDLINAFNVERGKESYIINMKKKQASEKMLKDLSGVLFVIFFVFTCFLMYRNVILSSEIERMYEALDAAEEERDMYWNDVNELNLQIEKMKKKRID